jgi:hypothetical protein
MQKAKNAAAAWIGATLDEETSVILDLLKHFPA